MGVSMAIIQPLFDKMIDVSFYLESGTLSVFDSIFTPITGRKPQIKLSGTLYARNAIADMQLTLVNFYTTTPLSNYQSMSIKAGYKNSVSATFEAQIFASYVDKPPPDSETVFITKVGQYDSFINQTFNKNYSKNSTTVDTILKDIALQMGLYNKKLVTVNYQPVTFSQFGSTQIPCDFNFPGSSICDCLSKISTAYKDRIVIRPEGSNLNVYSKGIGTGTIYQIDYITSARNDCGTFTIVAPWNPKIRPGDIVQANPAYFTQYQGGQFIGTNLFQVYTVNFEFDTCEESNQMTLVCIPSKGGL